MFDLGMNRTPKAATGPLAPKPAPAPEPAPAPAPKPPAIADQRDGVKGAPAITKAATAELPPEPWAAEKAVAQNRPNPYAGQMVGHDDGPEATGGAGPAGATVVTHTESVDEGDGVQENRNERASDVDIDKVLMAQIRRTNEAVAALPPDQKAQYDTVLASAKASGIPDADVALNNLVTSGRMTPEMLSDVAGIAQGPNCDRATGGQPEAINRVVGELLRQVDKPTSIVQDPVYQTCSEASVEFKMASENPGQYVKMVKDMVSANDVMTLPNGNHAGLAVYGLDNADGSGRSFCSAMFQQTLHANFSDGLAEGPIRSERMELMLNACFPGHADGGLTTFDQDQAPAATAALQPGAIALIEVPGQEARHAVTIMSNENGKISFFDSHAEGGIMTADATAFSAYLRGATLPEGTGVVDTQADFPVAGETGMNATTTTAGRGKR